MCTYITDDGMSFELVNVLDLVKRQNNCWKGMVYETWHLT